ncbi:MAG: right-handed parallel beta-helix repeat-containing protein, partial [Bacteroidales bacterium]|nr:right-handed parallel beta-helix repeat-containing protein [Bacteroidales bacterium]
MKPNFLSFTLLEMMILSIISSQAQPIVANHENINLEAIPVSWIETAKAELKIWYGHTSHGSQITTGISNIESHFGEPYTFNESGSGGQLSYQELNGYDLGHNGDLYWEYLTRQKLNNPANDRNVVIWSWCGGVSDNSVQGINTYLNAMSQLEQDYPEVMFVYMTGHLDIWSDANLKARNQQIRDYCLANDKILFDFADIESYDPDGNFYQYATDNCNYYEGPGWGYLGNWANEYCTDNPASEYCRSCSCAHSEPANCNMKGRVFWYLLARISGWNEHQEVFYVDKHHPEADDENPGTESLPWLTIQHALDVALPGDSVLIREGIYEEALTSKNNGNAMEGHIVFAAFPGEAVVIDGTDATENIGLRIENSYLKFYNLEIYNWSGTGIWMTGSGFSEIHNAEVHESVFGIGISAGSHDFLFIETTVHDFDLYGFDASPMGEDFCYNGTFVNCSAHSGRDPEQNVDGFALGHGAQHNFSFLNCTAFNVFDGFDISSAATTLTNCLAYDCLNTCYKLWQDQIELVNCIGHHGDISIVQLGWQEFPSETTLRNCTFSNAGVYTIWQANSNDVLNMYNCIVSGGDNIGLCFEQPSAANYHGDFNLFQNNNPARAINIGGAAEFSIQNIENGNWATFSGQDENSITADAVSEIYLGSGSGDFHLAPLSPAIDGASADFAPVTDFDGNLRPYGPEPDIGAYESLEDVAAYNVLPDNIDFGIIFTGHTAIETLTIYNVGEIPVTIDGINISNEVFKLPEISFPLEISEDFTIE